MKNKLGVLIVVIALAGLNSCEKGGDQSGVSTTPIDQLIQAGKPPVEIGPMSRGMSPIAPTFTMSLTNVSDAPVTLITGAVIFSDGNGKVLPDTIQEAGCADVSPIAPGTKVELQIMTSNEKAVKGRYLIKEAIYEKVNPKFKEYGGLPMKWKNPNYDAELKAEKAR